MKKLERRAFLCLLMAAALLAGLIFFIARLEINGAKWSALREPACIYEQDAACGRCFGSRR